MDNQIEVYELEIESEGERFEAASDDGDVEGFQTTVTGDHAEGGGRITHV